MQEMLLNEDENFSKRTSYYKKLMKISIGLFIMFAIINVALIYNFIKIFETI